MTDTDSEMMRRQQAKDSGLAIAADETHAKRDRADSDAASAAARDDAKEGRTHDDVGSQDAVLRENQRSDSAIEAEVFENGRTDAKAPAKPPLARNDRSILGR